MSIISVGDQLRPGTYRLHSRFRRAVNFIDGEGLIALVTEEIGPGPVNVVLRPLPDEEATPGDRQTRSAADAELNLRISDDLGRLVLGNLPFDLRPAERHDSRLPSGMDENHLRQNLPLLRDAIVREAPPDSLAFLLDARRLRHFRGAFAEGLARRLSAAVREVFRGDLLTGVSGLKGCGVGLTPSGDDFLAGLLIALNVMEASAGELSDRQHPEGRSSYRALIENVFHAAAGQSVFSNAMLDLACRGRLSARTKALLRALGEGDAQSVSAATEAVMAVGATSGADLAVGLSMALDHEQRFRILGGSARNVPPPAIRPSQK